MNPTRSLVPAFARFSLVSQITLALLASGALPGRAQDAFKTIRAFDSGVNATALLQSADGNLYGATDQFSGAHGAGSIFKLTLAGTLTTLYDFGQGATDASIPRALIDGGDGNFYGTSYSGGDNNNGTVFEFVPGSGLSILHSFDQGTDGYSPISLLRVGDGTLYGTTVGGSGTVFKLDPTGDLTTLHRFSVPTDNIGGPGAPLILATDGRIYGGTDGFGLGVVYRINAAGQFSVFHQFDGDDGASPVAGVIQGDDGNFYGVAESAGAHRSGTVFRLSPAGTLTTLHDFSAYDFSPGSTNPDGAQPLDLVRAADGNIYGVTGVGGPNSYGTIFQLRPNGKFFTLHAFDGDDGLYPGKLLLGNDGVLYGATRQTNTNGPVATIFRLNINGILQFTAPVYRVREEAGSIVIGVSRLGSAAQAQTVQYTTVDGSAKDGHDYTATSDTLSWAAGDAANKAVTVSLLNPGIEYGNGTRQFSVRLNTPTNGATFGTNRSASVVLIGTTVPPAITSPGAASGAVGAAFSYQIEATHRPSDFAATGLPRGLTLDAKTGLISGTPMSAGTHTLTLKAFNQGGEGTKTLTLTITLQAPVITSPATADGTLDAPFTYQITATGVPGRYAVEGLFGDLHVDSKTGLISGRASGVGTHTLTLHAFNSQGEGTQTLTLTVSKKTPTITSPATASGRVGQAFSYQITADGAPTQFGAFGLPTGLRVDAVTGLISGTPTKQGTSQLTLEAFNGKGKGTAALTLTISN